VRGIDAIHDHHLRIIFENYHEAKGGALSSRMDVGKKRKSRWDTI